MKDYTLINLTLLIFRDMVTKSNEPFCPQGFLNLGRRRPSRGSHGVRGKENYICDWLYGPDVCILSDSLVRTLHPIVMVLGGGALGR